MKTISYRQSVVYFAFIILVMLSAQNAPTYAQSDNTLNLIGHFGGSSQSVYVDDNKAYIGMGGALAVLDVSNPTHPTFIGKSKPLPISIEDIEVVNSIAYIIGYHKIAIMDVSNPEEPVLTTLYEPMDFPGYVTSMVVQDTIAYISYRTNVPGGMLTTVDMSDPTNLVLLSSIEIDEEPRDIAVDQGTAYVVAYNGWGTVVDVSDPTNLILLGSIDVGGWVEAVVLKENVAYIMRSSLVMVDVSDLMNPVLLDSSIYDGLSISVRDVDAVGTLMYVISYYGLEIIDMSDLDDPTVLGSIALSGFPVDIVVVGNLIYIADFQDNLVIVDVSDPTNPVFLSSIEQSGYATEKHAVNIVVGEDKIAYVPVRDQGLVIADISDLSYPTLISSVDMEYAFDLVVQDNVAYVITTGTHRLVTIDVSNPIAPTLLGSVDVGGFVSDIVVEENIAYLAARDDGLIMIDVSDPTTPTVLGSFVSEYVDHMYASGSTGTTDVFVVGTTAYIVVVTIAHRYGFNANVEIVDVSDPNNPVLLSTIYQGTPTNIVAQDGVAYITDATYSLVTADVSDPANPVLLFRDFIRDENSSRLGGGSDVVVEGEIAYIANASGLGIVDISDPDAPTILDLATMATIGRYVYIFDGVIYVTSMNGGVYMFEYTAPSLFAEEDKDSIGRLFLPFVTH